MTDHRLMTVEEYRETLEFYRRLDSWLYDALDDVARKHEGTWACPKRRTPDPAKLHRVLAEATSWEDIGRLVWHREEAKADEAFRRRMQDALEECLTRSPRAERRRKRFAAIIEKSRPDRPHPPLTPEEFFSAQDYFERHDYDLWFELDWAAWKHSGAWLRPEAPAASFGTLHVILACLTSWDDVRRIFRRPPGGVMEDHELRSRVTSSFSGIGLGTSMDDNLPLHRYYPLMDQLKARFGAQEEARQDA